MWKKILAITAAVCLLAGFAGMAAAQAPNPYKHKKQVTFERGDTIEGSLLTSGGNWVDAPSKIHFATLIDYRYDFVPEMLASSEDL